jgi:hypothetical protein
MNRTEAGQLARCFGWRIVREDRERFALWERDRPIADAQGITLEQLGQLLERETERRGFAGFEGLDRQARRAIASGEQ